jgi:hypothetical protein
MYMIDKINTNEYSEGDDITIQHIYTAVMTGFSRCTYHLQAEESLPFSYVTLKWDILVYNNIIAMTSLTFPSGLFLGCGLLPLHTLLQCLIFLALCSVLFQDL